jgi:hypothetical protein
MFGDYNQTFGLSFPLQQADAQGGLFAPNAPVGQSSLGDPAAPAAAPADPSLGADVVAARSSIGGSPAAGTPQPAPAQPSPLTSPLSLGGGQPSPQQSETTAPAAGVGSQFGKPVG